MGSGFSGECVKSGKVLRSDDADIRVDQESCRALGVRSIVAVPGSRWIRNPLADRSILWQSECLF